jgi:hypothetical protein
MGITRYKSVPLGRCARYGIRSLWASIKVAILLRTSVKDLPTRTIFDASNTGPADSGDGLPTLYFGSHYGLGLYHWPSIAYVFRKRALAARRYRIVSVPQMGRGKAGYCTKRVGNRDRTGETLLA